MGSGGSVCFYLRLSINTHLSIVDLGSLSSLQDKPQLQPVQQVVQEAREE